MTFLQTVEAPPAPSVKANAVLVFPASEPPASGEEPRFPYTPKPFPAIKELEAEAAAKYAEMERTGVDPLAAFAGCLKDVFTEDGLEYQRRMRDEWPD